MTSEETYIRLLLKCNKNNTRGNIDIDRSEFVLIFNEQQRNWVKLSKKINNSTSFTNEVNILLKPNVELSPTEYKEEYTSFTLPSDWWKVEYSYATASKEKCKAKLYLWEKKTANKGDLLTDAFNSPSFEWEESFVTIADNAIQVYKTDFEVLKLYIDYYRVPNDIDIEGYIKIDGSFSTTINPEIPDYIIDEILDMCKVEIMKNYENQLGTALGKDSVSEDLKP